MSPPPKQIKCETAQKAIKTEKKELDRSLSDNLLQTIFQYLPWSSVKSCRLVSRKWKGLVDSPAVLSCAAMNVVHPNTNIEERLESEMIKYVGKVNLKQPYWTVLIGQLIAPYSRYMEKNNAEADLTAVQKTYSDLSPFSVFPHLVVSLTKCDQAVHVTTHLDAKRICDSGSATDLITLIEKITNGEVKVESLYLGNFDVYDDEFDYYEDENGRDICKQYGKEVRGAEYFVKSLVKAVLACKEVMLENHGDPRGCEVGQYQPKVMNDIMRAVAKTETSKLKLRKLEFDFCVDYQLGVANNGGDVEGSCLDPNVFAAAVCKLEEVRFHGIPVDPELEEAMFKTIRDTPIKSLALKSLQIGFVTTKAQILASAATKLVSLDLHMASHKWATSNRHEQCSQAKAILDRIHKAKTLKLENLKIGLYDKIHHGGYKTYYGKRKKWFYPDVKMGEIKAKLKKLEIDDETCARDPDVENSDDEGGNCPMM